MLQLNLISDLISDRYSSYIGEGIDFAHLDTIIFAMPISFDGRIVKYLGHIGRPKQKCFAIDFVDDVTPMLRSSFTKRLKGYNKRGYTKKLNKNSNLDLFSAS